jgi:hypothetical protein
MNPPRAVAVPARGQREGPMSRTGSRLRLLYESNKELTESGELVGCQGLTPPGEAKIVRAGENGMPAVTDGPFPESKEFLVGYWIVDVDSAERAYEIAARASAAPGPGGVPLNMPIEVRQVMAGRPEIE